MSENENGKAEYIEHNVILFPNIVGTGAKITSAKYPKEKNVRIGDDKLIIFCPVPANDEEAVEMFGKTISEILADGVVQQFYKESFSNDALVERMKSGEAVDDEFLEYVRKGIEESLSEVKVRKAKSSVKADAAALSDLVKRAETATPEEIAEMVKEIAARKAQK